MLKTLLDQQSEEVDLWTLTITLGLCETDQSPPGAAPHAAAVASHESEHATASQGPANIQDGI